MLHDENLIVDCMSQWGWGIAVWSPSLDGDGGVLWDGVGTVVKYTGWAKKTGLFLRVDNFAKVGDRNARHMSKFSKFYPEKNIKLAYQCVKYSLLNLHKYSMSLKLR